MNVSVLFLTILACLSISGVASGADLNDKQYESLVGLTNRVASAYEIIDKMITPAGVKSVDYDRIQLGYAILFIVKHDIVGIKVESLFEKINLNLKNAILPHYIMFEDEMAKMLNLLMTDSESEYSADKKTANSPVGSTLIGNKRTFEELIWEAEMRLEKKTNYKFKPRDVRGKQ